MPQTIRHPFRVGRRAFVTGTLGLACESNSKLRAGRHRIALWFTYGGKNREVLEALVAKFNASQGEIFVEGVFQGDYFEGLAKLRVALAVGDPPALSHVVGEVIPYLAEAGALQRLDAFTSLATLRLHPSLGQAGSFIGGAERPLWALPFNRSTPIAYLNGQVFAEAGLHAPRTWPELVETARALTLRSGDRTQRFGFGCPIDWWFWVALLSQASGSLEGLESGRSLGGKAGLEAIQLWQHLVTGLRVMKPPPGRDYNAWEQTNQDFLAGRVAMIWTSTAFLKYLEQNARFPVIAAPLPAGERHAVPTGGTHWVITKASPVDDQVAAARFLEFMFRAENVIEWATRTGYIPVTLDAIDRLTERGHYQAHPNEAVALEQLAHAVPWPWSTQLFRVQREVIQPNLERAVLGSESAKQVFARAARGAG
ncbi:MAG TPA: ABC transporter substrate-binding protein [Polyangiaceae bacterium]|nr:ABC transporter substrate-binding protein [Polyangiaceae bacterium]